MDPIIVLVPGAWLSHSFYEPFLRTINLAGYSTHYARYPSLDPSSPFKVTCETDTEALASSIRPLVEDEGKDILLVMHSYAGMPGAAAATGLARSQRVKEGKLGGIIGLVFIAAFLVPEGMSCSGLQGGNLPSWILLDKPLPELNVPKDPFANFAADVDEELIGKLLDHIKPHSTLAFNSMPPHPAWADVEYLGKLAFIVTTKDSAIPKEAQYAMIGATQQSWITKEMDCSHCAPFLGKADDCILLLRGLIEKFMQ